MGWSLSLALCVHKHSSISSYMNMHTHTRMFSTIYIVQMESSYQCFQFKLRTRRFHLASSLSGCPFFTPRHDLRVFPRKELEGMVCTSCMLCAHMYTCILLPFSFQWKPQEFIYIDSIQIYHLRNLLNLCCLYLHMLPSWGSWFLRTQGIINLECPMLYTQAAQNINIAITSTITEDR